MNCENAFAENDLQCTRIAHTCLVISKFEYEVIRQGHSIPELIDVSATPFEIRNLPLCYCGGCFTGGRLGATLTGGACT